MTDLLRPILGEYTLQFDICFRTCLRFVFCTLLYSYPLQRKKGFALRVSLAFLLLILYSLGIAVLRTDLDDHLVHILCRLLNYVIVLPLLFLLYRESIPTRLLCWCAGVATEELAVHFFYLLLTLTGASTVETNSFFAKPVFIRDYTIYWAIQFAVYVACLFVFGKDQRMELDKITRRNIALLSVISALALGVLNSVTREFQVESWRLYSVILVFVLLFSLFILILRTGILSQGKYRQEISLMERLLHEEKKQYESVKENIDLINMKCHDLKHQLANFEGKLTLQEVQALQEAVSIYDSSIKTGSETLDVLLYENQLVCQKDSIKLSCMADGASLSFMSMSHVYSLFNNAIGNAIEAVRRVPDPEKRIVSITVRREGAQVAINITNYYTGEIHMADGLPITTKEDVNRHGFGMKSMQYVVEQYHGSLKASAEKDLFSLDVCFPTPENGEGCTHVS